MTALRLVVRSPSGLVLDEAVSAITAEDESGWFGILPNREDVVAVLPPGLLVYRTSGGEERFVANAGGLLDLSANLCRVTTPDAVVSSDLDEVTEAVARRVAGRRARRGRQTATVDDLAREALRRMVQEARS